MHDTLASRSTRIPDEVSAGLQRKSRLFGILFIDQLSQLGIDHFKLILEVRRIPVGERAHGVQSSQVE